MDTPGPCIACNEPIQHVEAGSLIDLIVASRARKSASFLIHRRCFERLFDVPPVTIGAMSIGPYDEDVIPAEIAEIRTPAELWPAYDVALERVRAGLEAGDAAIVEDGVRGRAAAVQARGRPLRHAVTDTPPRVALAVAPV